MTLLDPICMFECLMRSGMLLVGPVCKPGKGQQSCREKAD